MFITRTQLTTTLKKPFALIRHIIDVFDQNDFCKTNLVRIFFDNVHISV